MTARCPYLGVPALVQSENGSGTLSTIRPSSQAEGSFATKVSANEGVCIYQNPSRRKGTHVREFEKRFHSDRAAGGHRHHRSVDLAFASSRAISAEAARRIQCTNNLKQIGLALHNYLSANNTFPMGGTPQMDPTANGPGTASGPYEWENYSSFAMMLPFLEQMAVYNSCNLLICPDTGFGAGQPQNNTAYNTKLNAFLCPSDPYSGIQDLCNYAGCYGTTTYMPYDQVNSSVR